MKRHHIHIALASVFSLIPLLFHYWVYLGHFGFDDMRYAEIAHNLSTGVIDASQNFFFRFFLVGTTALSYKLFGISDITSALPAMLVTAGTVWLMFAILRKQHPVVALLAYVLFGFSSMTVMFSDKLSPDPFVTFSFMLVGLALYRQFTVKIGHDVLNALVLGFGVFLGVCAKETVLFMLPWLGVLFLWNLNRHKGQSRFWMITIGWGVLFGLVYMGILTLLLGDPFIRFQAAVEGQYVSFCSYKDQPFRVLLDRITIGMPAMLVQHGLFMPILPAAALGVVGIFKPRWGQLDRSFGLHVFLLLLTANFLSVSPSGYSPLCLDPRHYLFLVPLAALSVAPVIYEIINGRRGWRYILLLLVLVGAAWLAWQREFDSLTTISLPLLAWVVLAGFWPRKRFWLKVILTVAFVGAYGYHLIDYANYARSLHYPQQRAFVYDEVLGRGIPMDVYTDRVQARLGRYYKGFSADSTVVFYEFTDLGNETGNQNRGSWILYNGNTVWLAGITWEKLPALVKYALAHHEPVAVGGGSTLFDVDAFPALIQLDTVDFGPCNLGQDDGVCKINPGLSSDSLRFGVPALADTPYSAALLLVNVSLELKTQYEIEPELHFLQERDGTIQHHVGYPLFNFVGAFDLWSGAEVQQYYLMDEVTQGDSVIIWFHNPGEEAFALRNVRVVKSYMPRPEIE